MNQRTLLLSSLAICVFLSSFSSNAFAETNRDDDDSRSDRYYRAAPVRGEFTMGFITGGRRYDNESFTHDGGAGDIEGVSGFNAPFENAPFDQLLVLGLRYDLRLVVSYVRMTVGVDFPFASFDSRASRARYTLGEGEYEVTVQDIRPYELRFGIGGEYTFGPVTPYIDLLGTVHWVRATLAIEGENAEYEASSFGFAARAGARVHLREWFFITLSGEIGIVGDVFWGAELSVGFSVG